MLQHQKRQDIILYAILIGLIFSSIVTFCRPRIRHTVTEPAPMTVETPRTPNDPFFDRWN